MSSRNVDDRVGDCTTSTPGDSGRPLDQIPTPKGSESLVERLKPCPFCAGTRLENCTDDGRHWVRCMGCDATGPLGSKYDEDDDEDWNTRASALSSAEAQNVELKRDAERLSAVAMLAAGQTVLAQRQLSVARAVLRSSYSVMARAFWPLRSSARSSDVEIARQLGSVRAEIEAFLTTLKDTSNEG